MSANGVQEEEALDIQIVCLPAVVAPEIVPVILAFLYTDRLETNPENGPDGHVEVYTDPVRGNCGGRASADGCRQGGGKGWVEGEGEGEGEWEREGDGEWEGEGDVAASGGRDAAGSGEGDRGSTKLSDEVSCWSRVPCMACTAKSCEATIEKTRFAWVYVCARTLSYCCVCSQRESAGSVVLFCFV